MNVDWTDEMVNDLKKYESEAETFIPRCLSKNITSIKVSASCKPASPEDSDIIGGGGGGSCSLRNFNCTPCRRPVSAKTRVSNFRHQ